MLHKHFDAPFPNTSNDKVLQNGLADSRVALFGRLTARAMRFKSGACVWRDAHERFQLSCRQFVPRIRRSRHAPTEFEASVSRRA